MPAKLSIANYIVRLYRFRKDNPRSLLGVVEEVGVEGKRAFTNYDELWDILNSPKNINHMKKPTNAKTSLPQEGGTGGGERKKEW